MDNINNRCVHRRGSDIVICSEIYFLQRLAELLGFRDVHSHEFQDAVLCDDADHEGSFRLGVIGQ